MTTKQLAGAIHAHLRRFEADPKINQLRPVGLKGAEKLSDYWNSGACAAGRYVQVGYVSYQGSTSLTKAEAAHYLALLEGGFVGRHFEAFRRHPVPVSVKTS